MWEFLSLLLMAVLLSNVSTSLAAELDVWIGTTTPDEGPSKGIYHAKLNVAEGKLSPPRLVAALTKPGFVTVAPSGEVLYSTGTLEGEPVVAAFRIRRSGEHVQLERINTQPIGDGGATHVATDRTGKLLMTAQYGGGSVALYPLENDGSIGPQAQLLKHEGGSGVYEDRQDEPHAHWVGSSPDNRFVFVCDLGLDQVVIYRLDAAPPKLIPHAVGEVPPGSGPRHMKFHPSGKFAYVINELTLAVTTFEYNETEGTLKRLETVPMLSEQEKAKERFVSGSEIRVHPSGKYLYAGTRGHDSITVFAIDASGKLRKIQTEPIRGSWPRNFNVSPDGRWLIAAGRDSHTLSVFEINPDTGTLTYTLHTVQVPTPICVEFGAGE